MKATLPEKNIAILLINQILISYLSDQAPYTNYTFFITTARKYIYINNERHSYFHLKKKMLCNSIIHSPHHIPTNKSIILVI